MSRVKKISQKMSASIQQISICSFFAQKSMALDGWVDGWMDRWVDGRARLGIAYNNQKGEVS